MKTKTLKAAAAFGLSALFAGTAVAQDAESKSKPVGYETLTVQDGFNYFGLRLHEAPVANGVGAAGSAAAGLKVADGSLDSLDSSTTYLFEVTSGDASGTVLKITSFDAAGNAGDADDVSLEEDISADFAEGDTFTIRPVATLSTVFGSENSAALNTGQGNAVGADQIWLANDSGGFDRYYYDIENFNDFLPHWTSAVDGQTIINPDEIEIPYTDGIIVVGAGAENSFVVSGSVKLTDTSYCVVDGFNYLSSVSPVGATLESIFGATNSAGLTTGRGNAVGADQVWIPADSGFDRYYYDVENFNDFLPHWTSAADGQTIIDPATVGLDGVSGFIVVNAGGDQMLAGAVPSSYNNL